MSKPVFSTEAWTVTVVFNIVVDSRSILWQNGDGIIEFS